MLINFILLAALLAYSMIVSQSFMYILALKEVQLKLDAPAYTQFRKLIDRSMRSNFKYVIYASLVFTLALVIITIKYPGSLQFIMFLAAFLALLADTLITVKGNLPINDIINTWSATDHPADWAAYRSKWLEIFRYRQLINITGFICLLTGTIF